MSVSLSVTLLQTNISAAVGWIDMKFSTITYKANAVPISWVVAVLVVLDATTSGGPGGAGRGCSIPASSNPGSITPGWRLLHPRDQTPKHEKSVCSPVQRGGHRETKQPLDKRLSTGGPIYLHLRDEGLSLEDNNIHIYWFERELKEDICSKVEKLSVNGGGGL